MCVAVDRISSLDLNGPKLGSYSMSQRSWMLLVFKFWKEHQKDFSLYFKHIFWNSFYLLENPNTMQGKKKTYIKVFQLNFEGAMLLKLTLVVLNHNLPMEDLLQCKCDITFTIHLMQYFIIGFFIVWWWQTWHCGQEWYWILSLGRRWGSNWFAQTWLQI